MKIEKITPHYTEKRSASYQTCEHGMSIEVSLAEGEKPTDAIAKYQSVLRDQVTEFTWKEVYRLAEEANQMPGGRR